MKVSIWSLIALLAMLSYSALFVVVLLNGETEVALLMICLMFYLAMHRRARTT